MNLAQTQLMSRSDFTALMKGFLWGSVSEDLPELAQIAHADHGILTVVLFENHKYVLVIKGGYQDPRGPESDTFPKTSGSA